jgi:hypothetical protein
VFTAPASGWYKVAATFSVTTAAAQAALALMIDANVGRMLYFTGAAGAYQPVALNELFQLTAGQKITIGYRPASAAKAVTMINSGTVVPLLLVEEAAAPQ